MFLAYRVGFLGRRGPPRVGLGLERAKMHLKIIGTETYDFSREMLLMAWRAPCRIGERIRFRERKGKVIRVDERSEEFDSRGASEVFNVLVTQ